MGRLSSLSFLSSLSLALVLLPAAALPLSTDSRWIVDETGRRVKLACVNWASHLEAVVAEGLSKQPVDNISKKIASMGFNCVRLTWPLFLATNESLANLTVRKSFLRLGLVESVAGFQVNNPSLIDLSLINAYQAVVYSLANNNVMVIMDNHISRPGWCCSNDDGSGFFGDRYFNPDLWIRGLTRMATMFKDTPYVVGMSLRNELRGNKSNVDDWYRYMQKGAEAVHAANPNVLVILSGLSYSKDLSFLLRRPVNLTFTKKLVFEVHWYSFSDAYQWGTGNPNQVCAQIVGNVMRRAGFVVDQLGYPLFVSEFGVDQRGINVNDNRYLNCFMAVSAELDWEWALWTLAGSYYLREGGIGADESYGILNWNWCEARNSSFLDRISAIQSPFRGPGVSEAKLHQVIFHPLTGLCVVRKSLLEPPKLGPCAESDAWSYSQQKTLTIKGTYFCLQADALGKPARLGIFCSDNTSKWEQISDSKMHLSSQLNNGTMVCLDIDPATHVIVTNTCKCLSRENTCDPGSQWFKIVDSTRCIGDTTSFKQLNSVLNFFGKNILGGLIV